LFFGDKQARVVKRWTGTGGCTMALVEVGIRSKMDVSAAVNLVIFALYHMIWTYVVRGRLNNVSPKQAGHRFCRRGEHSPVLREDCPIALSGCDAAMPTSSQDGSVTALSAASGTAWAAAMASADD